MQYIMDTLDSVSPARFGIRAPLLPDSPPQQAEAAAEEAEAPEEEEECAVLLLAEEGQAPHAEEEEESSHAAGVAEQLQQASAPEPPNHPPHAPPAPLLEPPSRPPEAQPAWWLRDSAAAVQPWWMSMQARAAAASLTAADEALPWWMSLEAGGDEGGGDDGHVDPLVDEARPWWMQSAAVRKRMSLAAAVARQAAATAAATEPPPPDADEPVVPALPPTAWQAGVSGVSRSHGGLGAGADPQQQLLQHAATATSFGGFMDAAVKQHLVASLRRPAAGPAAPTHVSRFAPPLHGAPSEHGSGAQVVCEEVACVAETVPLPTAWQPGASSLSAISGALGGPVMVDRGVGGVLHEIVPELWAATAAAADPPAPLRPTAWQPRAFSSLTEGGAGAAELGCPVLVDKGVGGDVHEVIAATAASVPLAPLLPTAWHDRAFSSLTEGGAAAADLGCPVLVDRGVGGDVHEVIAATAASVPPLPLRPTAWQPKAFSSITEGGAAAADLGCPVLVDRGVGCDVPDIIAATAAAVPPDPLRPTAWQPRAFSSLTEGGTAAVSGPLHASTKALPTAPASPLPLMPTAWQPGAFSSLTEGGAPSEGPLIVPTSDLPAVAAVGPPPLPPCRLRPGSLAPSPASPKVVWGRGARCSSSRKGRRQLPLTPSCYCRPPGSRAPCPAAQRAAPCLHQQQAAWVAR